MTMILSIYSAINIGIMPANADDAETEGIITKYIASVKKIFNRNPNIKETLEYKKNVRSQHAEYIKIDIKNDEDNGYVGWKRYYFKDLGLLGDPIETEVWRCNGLNTIWNYVKVPVLTVAGTVVCKVVYNQTGIDIRSLLNNTGTPVF